MAGASLTRHQLIRRRWRVVSAVGVLTFSLEFLALHLDGKNLDQRLQQDNWPLGALAGIAFAMVLFIPNRRLVGIVGIRHAFAYPPYWFGIAIGIAAASWATAHYSWFSGAALSEESEWNLALVSTVCAALLFLAVIVARLMNLSAKPGDEGTSWTSMPKPLAERDLSSWYLHEGPVVNVDDDFFGHRSIARRIALRLIQPHPEAQAVVGRIGTGKSTLRNLVAAYLAERRSHPPVKLISVELWPYETPRAAVEGILDAVIEAFSDEISTSQLNGIPAEYGEVVARITGVAKWLPKAVERKPELPSSLLQRFDDVATMIGRRYVLWVEDLERFATGHGDAPGTPSELERLAPIRALLAGLDQLRSITVVTATTDLFRRFDLEKIARYIENVPELNTQTSRRIISEARRNWLSGKEIIHVGGYYNPNRHSEQLGWDGPNSVDDVHFAKIEAYVLDDRIVLLAHAVAALATTPRILKQGLRRAHETWMALRGEIDVDDVIALCMLQEASPNTFALLQRSASSLRSRGSRFPGEKDAKTLFDEELKNLQLDPRTLAAANVIVKHVFIDGRNRPQSVGANSHTDYWYRFLALPELSPKIRDQRVLTALRDCDDDKLAIELDDNQFERAIVDFSDCLPDDRIAKLLKAVIERRLREDPSTWPSGHAAGLVPICRIAALRRRSEVLESLRNEVERGMRLAAPINLMLLYELVFWFVESTAEAVGVFEESVRVSLMALSVRLMVESHRGKPDSLANALKGARRFVLFSIAYGFEQSREDAREKPFDGWEQFAPTLLDALKAAPDVVAEQVAPFVLRADRERGGPNGWIFDVDACERLFGDPKEFVNLVRKETTDRHPGSMISAILNGERDIADRDVARPAEPS
jgi:hypothetical protein